MRKLVPAMALVTQNLGFGLTASLSFEQPYTFAHHAFDSSSGLIYSGLDHKRFAILFAVRKDRAGDAALRKCVASYQSSPKVRASISKAFADNRRLYTLPWESDGHM